MNQTERLYHIDKLLRANRCVPMARFLDELGVSIATFKRDLEHLRSNLNAPIEWDRACRGYRLAEASPAGPRYELPGLWFNPSEILALLTIEHLLKEIEPGVLHQYYGMMRQRLAETLGRPDPVVEEIDRRIFIRSRFKRPTSPRFFETVVAATLERRPLLIRHDSRFKGQVTERTVSPQRLIHYREVWYLVAWCHLREAVRTFALDNLLEVTLLDGSAHEVPADELDATLDRGYGIWSGQATQWATLRFHPASARWAASETWHRNQRAHHEADGSYIIEVPYSHPDELVMDVLKYGAGCTVMAPESLRMRVLQQLQEAVSKYGVGVSADFKR